MGWAKWITNAVRGRADGTSRPSPGQMVSSTTKERWRSYPADGLTPSTLIAILREADDGAIDRAMALYQHMEEKDAHLYSVAQTRRLAVTGLDWQIVSAADLREGVDRVAADEAADYCREVLSSIDSFDEVLAHLSLAMGRNISVAENIWETTPRGLRLIDIAPVDYDRLTFDEAQELRVLTEEERVRGVRLPPFKFVVHTPQTVSGHPMRGGLLRVSAIAYLGKHLSMKDWMIYSEVFGMPVRIARYDPSISADEKRELLRMLQSLGSDAAGIFSKAIELQLLEAGRGAVPPPYETICNFFNRELSKAWLGQTLTVEVLGGAGGGANASGPKVHNEVRLDLRQDDLAREGRTIRRDVLSPLIEFGFPADTPVPFFRRRIEPSRDLRELVDVLNVAVNDLGMAVPSRWARSVLGVPGNDHQPLAGRRR